MNNNELDALFTGLTGKVAKKEEMATKTVATVKVRKPAVGKDRLRQRTLEKERNEERFCTIVDSDVLNKIRIIAKREGLQIKNVIEAALIKAIDGYEHKHGVIEENAKRNAIDLF